MKITIESIEVKEDQMSAIIHIQSSIESIQPYEIARDIQHLIKERLADAYVQKNLDIILSSIDHQNVINAVVLRAADKVVGK